ncbi:16916_t:CDS:2, partial [Gigaspora margarita]
SYTRYIAKDFVLKIDSKEEELVLNILKIDSKRRRICSEDSEDR